MINDIFNSISDNNISGYTINFYNNCNIDSNNHFINESPNTLNIFDNTRFIRERTSIPLSRRNILRSNSNSTSRLYNTIGNYSNSGIYRNLFNRNNQTTTRPYQSSLFRFNTPSIRTNSLNTPINRQTYTNIFRRNRNNLSRNNSTTNNSTTNNSTTNNNIEESVNNIEENISVEPPNSTTNINNNTTSLNNTSNAVAAAVANSINNSSNSHNNIALNSNISAAAPASNTRFSSGSTTNQISSLFREPLSQISYIFEITQNRLNNNNNSVNLNTLLSESELIVYNDDTRDQFSEERCSICSENYSNGDIIRKIRRCGHYFHQSCVDRWFGTNSTCPICRGDINNEINNSTHDNNDDDDDNVNNHEPTTSNTSTDNASTSNTSTDNASTSNTSTSNTSNDNTSTSNTSTSNTSTSYLSNILNSTSSDYTLSDIDYENLTNTIFDNLRWT